MPSFDRKNPSKSSRLVWRMTPSSPMGEWVDPSVPLPSTPKKTIPVPRTPTDPTVDTSFTTSSFDLLRGVEVQDSPDTVPDDLFDELFGRPAPGGSQRNPS
jgi:hypothetical protein